MKALIAIAVSLALLLGCGLVGMTLVSVPAASDEQRGWYQAEVRRQDMEIPWEALLAVDAVRFHQDFSQVTRQTVKETAKLFALCLPFWAIEMRFEPPPEDPDWGFTVPRQGRLHFLVQGATGVEVVAVDAQGKWYRSGNLLPPGDYNYHIVSAPEDEGFQMVHTMDLKPCGPEEVELVMDRLGLEGDDRRMVLHLLAMSMPPSNFYPILDPTGPYVWPLAGDWPITSPFGPRLDPVTGDWSTHTGVDIGADEGTAVHAAAGGQVIFAGYEGNYGNVVRIQHEGGNVTAYAHLNYYLVEAGQQVSRGEAIGLVGNTGKSTGTHLHFEWRVNGIAVDPLPFYRQEQDQK
jgi:murein DD-endopeptidase MepM/ murein hydrolase activator NlpD